MSTPFLGQLMLFPFNFAPKGWTMCNGQLLSIQQNQALFSLLGTTFGGDGRTTFGLPNLQGRTPVGAGGGFNLGQTGGEESHTLTINEVPAHFHSLNATTTSADKTAAANNVLGTPSQGIYAPPGNIVGMNQGSISAYGGSQPHENRQPFLVMTWCIALQGIFPSQN